jgi:hypothetical protein
MKTDQPNRTNPPQHLAALSEQPPASGTGKVVWAWPWIEAALARGWGVREIWRALEADGLAIPFDQFRVYVPRVWKRMARQQEQQQRQQPAQPTTPPPQQIRAPALQPPALTPSSTRAASPPTPPNAQPAPHQVHDPYASAREQRRRKASSGFEYDPFSINKNLLE